jgi:hypothetical protein
MLTGAVVGALGGAGIARVLNVARNQTEDVVRWDDAFIERLAGQALLRYLAIAHYGRGRGSFVESESPTLFRTRVENAMAQHREVIDGVIAQRAECDAAQLAGTLTPALRSITLAVLADLYPGTVDPLS